jgi:tRNA modification GTPase
MIPSAVDIIAAIASPPGAGPRGIVRISGPTAIDVAIAACRLDPAVMANRRQARRCPGEMVLNLASFNESATLTVDLYVWPDGRSYTGEPLVEIHTVSSPPLLNLILKMLFEHGVRPAQPGEFTMRAFLAGRLDLVQAEAVLGVIDAAGHAQLSTALAQLAGGISQRMGELREQLLLHLADLEAGLDFVEEDIEFVQREQLQHRLAEAGSMLRQLLSQAEGRMTSTSRPTVVLAGLPNAGKSTLFNRLVGNEAAIVSPIAGTTRDFVHGRWCVVDRDADLIDTAGWELAATGIEGLSQAQRQAQFERADLILWCTAATLSPEESVLDRKLLDQLRSGPVPVLPVATKTDELASPADGGLQVSGITGAGLVELAVAVRDRLADSSEARSDLLASTAVRCRESLQSALDSIIAASELANAGAGDELIACELRESLEHLGRITGAVYTDDILDRIFSRFCIGK